MKDCTAVDMVTQKCFGTWENVSATLLREKQGTNYNVFVYISMHVPTSNRLKEKETERYPNDFSGYLSAA